jgi:hypothetical protein
MLFAPFNTNIKRHTMDISATSAPARQLIWNGHGPSVTNGLKTYNHQRAAVSDFTFIPGFTDLSQLLSAEGYSFSESASGRAASVGAFERTLTTEFVGGRHQELAISYSFFASIRFTRQLDTGTLILHRAARGVSSDSVDSVARTVALDPTSTASLTWRAKETLVGATHASLVSLALFVYGLALPLSEQFGSIEIPYRRPPTKRQPNGRNDLFTMSAGTLKSKLPGGQRSDAQNGA